MRRILFALLLALCGYASAARAQDVYPGRPIRLVVPYPAGGTADAMARALGQELTAAWGQPVVVDNRPGASTIIGADVAARSPPDGYTLLFTTDSTLTINPMLHKRLPYDPQKDFAPISMTTAYPYILVVNAELPAKTLAEFVALAKSKPGTMNYGSTGVGAANHLVAELFNSKAGLKMTHIPYRGTALATADLVAGQLTLVFGDPISVLPHIQSGKLRALAVTSLQRSSVAPTVPTVAESGYPGFEALAWHGILAPARTPPEIVAKLNAEIVKAVNDLATKALLANQAMQTVGSTPEEFAAFIRNDIATWKAVAMAANVTVE